MNNQDKKIRFDGQTAVVTGAGQGLGRAYALALADRGACVVVNDVSAEHAEAVTQEIVEAGGKAVSICASVSSPEGGSRIIEAAVDYGGHVDILINNAGNLRDKSFVKMTAEEWRAVLEVHLDGAYYVTHPAIIRMREQGYGRILLTVSSAGLYGNFGQMNYSSAKMGLIGFMNTLKQEIKKYDIMVNAISPTALSRMTEKLFSPKLAKMADPLRVVPMALLLCSKLCPVNGQIFRAGLGHFARVALVTGPGMAFPGEPPTPEQILTSMDKIADLTYAREIDNTSESLKFSLKALGEDMDDPM